MNFITVGICYIKLDIIGKKLKILLNELHVGIIIHNVTILYRTWFTNMKLAVMATNKLKWK